VELALPRNHKGKLWQLDKVRRWRSKEWRTWVRGLIPAEVPVLACGPGGLDIVIAAHFRYPGCGIGTRPADCFVYPMHDADHKAAHSNHQPHNSLQWRWVTETMMQGMKWDKLGGELDARAWIATICASAMDSTADLSTPAIEAVAVQWASYFLSGDLWINKNGGM